ncbi:MAG: SGNH/GDSL hydrolase family protein [Deltaproteobacteria bacterium]|nr:SGNH/GDSL hydrolase family protein [Deltaproteobacteria bacterium]MBW2394454.1 SGNH/GDSL hydrolase family protein [Deltaproteobacteria bacterium]
MKSFLKSLGLITATVLAYLVILEIAVRYVVDDGMQYDLEMWKYAKELKRVSSDPGIGHEHRPNSAAHLMGVDVTINSTGQRGIEFTRPKPDRTVRILMLGDSLTFGWGVENEHTVTGRLASHLRRGGPDLDYEVVNAGVGNYNAAMSSHWMRARGMDFEPDLVVFNFSFNDAETTPQRMGGGLAEWSYAYVYFRGRLGEVARRVFGGADWSTYYRELYADDTAGWREAQEQLGLLAQFCKQQSVPLVLVNYPELHELDPYPLADVSNKIQALSRRLGLPYLDLLDAIRSERPEALWITPGDPHPNAYADSLIADALFGFLRDGGWL